MLATPTCTPPKWVVDDNPDMIPYDEQGRPRGFGSRRHYTFSSENYWRESRRIVEILCQRYGAHPHVVGWQTDNEFGCHDSGYCYCPNCAAAFRRWLQQKYGTLAELNRAWGGAFWGEIYGDWEHIPAPTQSAAERSPSHVLDYYRFSSDAWRDATLNSCTNCHRPSVRP